jgi:hypothetical protein
MKQVHLRAFVALCGIIEWGLHIILNHPQRAQGSQKRREGRGQTSGGGDYDYEQDYDYDLPADMPHWGLCGLYPQNHTKNQNYSCYDYGMVMIPARQELA